MVPLNYNFISPCVFTRGAMRNLQCIPVMCWHRPCFLRVWNIHVSCNLPCATHGMAMRRIAIHGKATHGIAMPGIAMHGVAML